MKDLVRRGARKSTQMQTEMLKKPDSISFAARPNATASEAQALLPPHGPRNASGIKPCGLRMSEAKEEENMVNTLASPAALSTEIKLVDAAI